MELETQRRRRAVLDSQEQTLFADLKSRQAGLEFARTNLGYARIVAPQDGIVSERKVRAGQFVSPGTQIVSFVEKQIWVEVRGAQPDKRAILPERHQVLICYAIYAHLSNQHSRRTVFA